jgi:hypothetical protein
MVVGRTALHCFLEGVGSSRRLALLLVLIQVSFDSSYQLLIQILLLLNHIIILHNITMVNLIQYMLSHWPSYLRNLIINSLLQTLTNPDTFCELESRLFLLLAHFRTGVVADFIPVETVAVRSRVGVLTVLGTAGVHLVDIT